MLKSSEIKMPIFCYLKIQKTSNKNPDPVKMEPQH